MKSYKDLIVWRKSIGLVKEIYLLTNKFPKSELYGIVSQMRRAVVSIPSNIAEGWGRRSDGSRLQSFSVANGSALELETQLILAKELSMAKLSNFQKSEALLQEVLRMLNTMTRKKKFIS